MSSNICWLCKLFREDENGISSNFIFKPRIRHTVNLNSNPTITFPLLQRVSLEEVLQWSQSFENLMTTKYGPVIYKTYLKTEYSDENIEFWLACETYKKIASRRKRISVARKIFKNYIQPLAPKEINIDSPAREAIIRNIQEPTQSCFDEAQRIVYMHMERDSYPRFLGSEIYQKLKHRFQIHSNDS